MAPRIWAATGAGFTLIELLLVIGIIAILAAIVIVAVNPTKQLLKAQDAKRDHGANQLEKAVAQYQIANGKLPNDGLILSGTGSAKQVCAQGMAEARTAAQFTSANAEYLSIANNASLQTGDIDFTLAGWIYKETNTDFQYVASKYDSAADGEWGLYNDATGALTFNIWNISNRGTVTSGVLAPRAWHFFVVWHNAATNTVNMQINNGTVISAATTGAPASTAASLRFGAYLSSPAHHFDGRQDSMAFWRRALTAGERSWLYNAGHGRSYAALGAEDGAGDALKESLASWWDVEETGGTRSDAHGGNHLADNNTVASAEGWSGTDTSCIGLDALSPTFVASIPRDTTEGCANYTGYRIFHDGPAVRVIPANKGKTRSEAGSTLNCGLVGYWPLDESTGLTVKDASGNGNQGTIVGSPVSSTNVPAVVQFADPYSLSFNGTDDYVDMGQPATLRPPAQISYGGWVNWTSFAQDSAGHAMMSFAVHPNFGFMLYQATDDPRNRIQNFIVTTAGAGGFAASTLLATGTWYHVFVTYDGANMLLYINGTLAHTRAYTGKLQWNGVNTNFYLGTTYYPWGLKFHGLLDDMRVYNRALSAGEVADLAAGRN